MFVARHLKRVSPNSFVAAKTFHLPHQKAVGKAHSQTMLDDRSFGTCAYVPQYSHFNSQNKSLLECRPSVDLGASHDLPHPIWTQEYMNAVEITHRVPEKFVDRLGYWTVQFLRRSFDLVTGYATKPHTESMMINRMIFLETVAGVPGSVGATIRHLASLRRMKRDHGWIHTLLEEAENERIHLLTAIEIKKPGLMFRAAVAATQLVFYNWFFLAYLISPRFCHSFVGYLEEEAVKTYTAMLQDLDAGKLPEWSQLKAPRIAINYWQLPEDATWRDVLMVVRADEAHHRRVNHEFAVLPREAPNPFKPGQ